MQCLSKRHTQRNWRQSSRRKYVDGLRSLYCVRQARSSIFGETGKEKETQRARKAESRTCEIAVESYETPATRRGVFIFHAGGRDNPHPHSVCPPTYRRETSTSPPPCSRPPVERNPPYLRPCSHLPAHFALPRTASGQSKRPPPQRGVRRARPCAPQAAPPLRPLPHTRRGDAM